MSLSTFYIISMGCASNEADSLSIIASLTEHGLVITNKLQTSDIIIILTCGFSHKQNEDSITLIKDTYSNKRGDAQFWVGGCIPAMNLHLLKSLGIQIDLFFTPRNFKAKFEDYFKQLCFSPNQQSVFNRLSYPIRIVNGCTEHCSYCIIKRAGGSTKSRTVDDIIKDVRNLGNNISNLNLVGEEVGAYGMDIGANLCELINCILAVRPDLTISFSAIHPKYFIQDFDSYVGIYKSNNIKKVLPLPIQSGSNKLLRKMGRDYDIDTVVSRIHSFLAIYPDVSLSTDIMVGYPTESWDDFLMSKDLVESLPLSALDCFKFDDMNGLGNTVAECEKIKRLKIIALAFIRKFCNEHNIGSKVAFDNFTKHNKLPLNINY